MGSYLILISIAGSGLAAFISGWLLLKGSTEDQLPGCGADSSCDAALRSRWARLFSIPVAALGLAAYLILLVCSIGLKVGLLPQQDLVIRHLNIIVALCTLGGAIWFTAIQLLVLHRLCRYCTLTHLFACVAASALIAAAMRAGLSVANDGTIAACAIATLIACQAIFEQPAYALTPASKTPMTSQETTAKLATLSTAEQPGINLFVPKTDLLNPQSPTSRSVAPFERYVQLFGDRINIKISQWPLIGSPLAPNVFALLMDFTCKECHHLLRLVYGAVMDSSGSLAVAIVPVPIHRDCNPTVTCRKQEQAFSCAFARLTWAIWLQRPATYSSWIHFLTSSSQIQPFGVARDRAGELCDLGGFKITEGDPALDERIIRGVKLASVLGQTKVPALLLPQGVLRGHVQDQSDLLRLLGPSFRIGVSPSILRSFQQSPENVA